MTQTVQQQRAAFALQQVQAVPLAQRKAYSSYAQALPFMIHANGLGQAAAFYRSKGDAEGGAYASLYNTLSSWLTESAHPFKDYDDLLEGITQSDMDAYLAAQAEAMMLMDWVKKFAKAFAAGEKESSEKDEAEV